MSSATGLKMDYIFNPCTAAMPFLEAYDINVIRFGFEALQNKEPEPECRLGNLIGHPKTQAA